MNESSPDLDAAIEAVVQAKRTLADAEQRMRHALAEVTQVVEPTPTASAVTMTILVTPRRRHLVNPATGQTYCGRLPNENEPPLQVDAAVVMDVTSCTSCLAARRIEERS